MYLDKRGNRLKVELHRGTYDPNSPHGNPDYPEHGSMGTYETWQGHSMSCYVLVNPNEYFYILIKWIGRAVDRETFATRGANALAINLDIDDGRIVKNNTIYLRFDQLDERNTTLGGLVHDFRKEQLEEDINGALVNAQDYVEGREATESDKLYSRTFAVDGIHKEDDKHNLSVVKFRADLRNGHQDMVIGEEDLDSPAPRYGSVTVKVDRVHLVSSTRSEAFMAREDGQGSQPRPSDQDLIDAGIPLRIAFEQVPCPIKLRLPVRVQSVQNGLVGIYKFNILPRAQFDRIKAEQPANARVDKGPAPGIAFLDLDEEQTDGHGQLCLLRDGTGFNVQTIPGTASGIGSYLDSFPALAIAETKAEAKLAADQAARDYAKHKKSEASKQEKQAQVAIEIDACTEDGSANESIIGQAVPPANLVPSETSSAQDIVSFQEDDAGAVPDLHQLRPTAYYPRAGYHADQTRASTVFVKMFPDGYETLQTSNAGLLCGLNVAILSLHSLHLMDTKIPVPTLAKLQEWQDSDEYRARIIQFDLGQNDNHLFVDQIALIVQLWAEREHNCPLQLGYLRRGQVPQLVPYSPLYENLKMGRPKVVFIWNDNVAAEDEQLVNHFQGMRKVELAVAGPNEGDLANSVKDKQDAQDMVANEVDVEMGGHDNSDADCDMPDADSEPPAAQNQPIGMGNVLYPNKSQQNNAMPPPSAPKNHKPLQPFANQARNQSKHKKLNNQNAPRHLHGIQGPGGRIAKKKHKQRLPYGAPRGPRADLWPHQGPDLYRPSYLSPRRASPEFQNPRRNRTPASGVNAIPLLVNRLDQLSISGRLA